MEDELADRALAPVSTSNTAQNAPPVPQPDGLAALTVPALPSSTPVASTPPGLDAAQLATSAAQPPRPPSPPATPQPPSHAPAPPSTSGTSRSSPAPAHRSPSQASSGMHQTHSTKTIQTARRARPPSLPRSSRPPPSPSSSSAVVEEPERPATNLRHGDKLRICEISDKNPRATQGDIVDIFFAETGRRLERSTISRIVTNKALWKRAGATDAARKRFGTSRYPAVEAALFELIRNRSREEAVRRTLSDEDILTLAKRTAATIVEHMPSDSKESQTYAPLLRNFSGSRSWLNHFKKRWALSSKEESHLVHVIDPQSGGMRLSDNHLRDSFNIWSKRLNMVDTVELISNWTRMEDLYVLDALVLSTDALPDHAKKVVSRGDQCDLSASNLGQSARLPVPAFFGNGVVDAMEDEIAIISNPDHSIAGPPSMSASNAAESESARSVADNGSSAQGTDSCHDVPRDAMFMPEEEEVVDDDNAVVLLLGTNATGNDFKAPWMIGKVPIGRLGSREGDVWRDCSVRYFHNGRGWLSASILHSWVKEFDASLDRSVLLVSSLFSLCDLDLLDLKYVTLLPVPRTELVHGKSAALELSNVSNSPIHLGIEQSFRARYRSLVIERALKFMIHKQQIRAPSLEASARMIEKAWRKVTSSDVRRAWHSLHYVPMRFRKPLSRSRSPAQNKQGYVEELKRNLLSYSEALEEYSKLGNVDVNRDGVQCAVDDLAEYVWLSREPSVFHPYGSVLDFARTAVQENTKDNFEDSFTSKGPKHKVFPAVDSAAEALEAANHLAQFVVKQPDKLSQDVLHWVGNLQLALKRMRDEIRNEDIEKEWGSAPKRSRVT